MNYLIDTHILLWCMVGDSRVGQDTRQIIEDQLNTIFVSNASLWEIAIKVSIGKLKLRGTISDIQNYLKDKGLQLIEFDYKDLETLLSLPFHHQDPFDRLIVAQAKTKNLEIITNDKNVKTYFS